VEDKTKDKLKSIKDLKEFRRNGEKKAKDQRKDTERERIKRKERGRKKTARSYVEHGKCKD
jgi:hypothetical protein